MAEMYSEKDPGEVITYGMDFSAVLATGETISTCSAAMTTYQGVDASPSSLLSGAPSISGGGVYQTVTGGSDGVTYRLRFVATTSTSRVLVGAGYLPVNAA